MKFFSKSKDGGPESTVTGYWLFESKRFGSIVLLRFGHGSRDAYHNHAFNSISWLLRGALVELHKNGKIDQYAPSLRPIITKRDTFHQVLSIGTSWVISFRGPWETTWNEWIPLQNRFITLTSERKIVQDNFGKEPTT